MKIVNKTRHWQYLWDYLPIWEEDPSGGGLGEDEDQIDEQSAQENQDGQQEQDDPEGNQRKSGESQSDEDDSDDAPGGGDEDDSSDDDGSGEGPEQDEENSQDEGSDESEHEDNSDNAGRFGIEDPQGEDSPRLKGYRIVKNPDGSEDHIREFSSWWDFIQSANDQSLRRYKEFFASHGSQFIGTFDRGTKDFQQAVDMALRTGWPEGRRLLDDQITTAIRQPKLVDHWSFDVAGAFPNVPMFCAGDPACMVIDPMNDLKQQVPIVRIDYNFVVSHTTPIESIMTRGAAVVSLANNLERQGIQTELRIIGNQRGWDNKTFRISIVYKRAGEQLDLDRAAFAIAHPSVLRRLLLAIMEQHAEIETSMGGSYGRPLHEPNDPTSGQLGGAIFIRGAQYDETPTSARRAVEEAAQAVLGQQPDSERKAAA